MLHDKHNKLLDTAMKQESLLDPGIVRQSLNAALAQGADFAEVYAERRVTDTVRVEEQVVREASRGLLLGVGIRALNGEEIGYAYTDGIDPKAIVEAAKVAGQIAKQGKSIHPIEVGKVSFAELRSRPRIYPPDFEGAKKIEIARSADDAARSTDRRIREVLAAVIDSDKIITVANSEGTFVTDHQVVISLRIIVIAEQNGLRQRGMKVVSGSIGYEIFDEHDPRSCATEAAHQAIRLLEAQEAPAGKMTLVLGSGRGGVLLHEAIGHGFEGDFIRKRTSIFAGKIGQQVASELCTIIDDGSIPGLRGTINIDDEGTLSQRTILVENGILKSFLYDRLNARLVDARPTGNGRRQSYRFMPTVRMTNTFMLGGSSAVDEIIGSVKKGFYAKRIGGGQVDIASGNFVFEVIEGYLIENGKVGPPVRGANLIGNGAEILKKIDMVGNDFAFDTGGGTCGKAGQLIPVGNGIPTVRISEITVGGTKA